MKFFAKEDVLEKAREYNVKFIRLQFTNILGAFKNIAITVDELPRALEGQMLFDSAVVEGFVRNKETDICLLPDPSTFVVFPWRPREGAVARLICDIHQPGGEPFPGCPRVALRKSLNKAEQQGLQFQVGAEIEFFLLHANEQGKPTVVTHDRAGYCDLSPVDLGENARRDMVLTLQEMGFDVTSSHHEKSPGQHEIFLKTDDALATADNISTFKFVVRTIAQRHGLHASFMPKPFSDYNGSGMHLHQFLWRDGENVFSDPDGALSLSEDAYHYIGGLLKHAGAITAITNPLVNSYKRLRPGCLAPVLAAWSQHNRSTMIRVPAQRGQGTRIILRNPDPTGNPYLALAVSLEAGLDGLSGSIEPPAPLGEDEASTPTLKKLIMDAGLPRSLEQALYALASDTVVRNALGPYIYQRYAAAKEAEWDRYSVAVHQWELDEYLSNY